MEGFSTSLFQLAGQLSKRKAAEQVCHINMFSEKHI
jgi:hypothetical protein